MSYGMTYEQYWYGDPWMTQAFYQAYLLEKRSRNEEMWIQGAYIANAVAVAIHNAFDKHKINYLENPLDVYPKAEVEKQEEIRTEKLKVVQKLSMISANFKAKQKGTDQNGKS